MIGSIVSDHVMRIQREHGSLASDHQTCKARTRRTRMPANNTHLTSKGEVRFGLTLSTTLRLKLRMDTVPPKSRIARRGQLLASAIVGLHRRNGGSRPGWTHRATDVHRSPSNDQSRLSCLALCSQIMTLPMPTGVLCSIPECIWLFSRCKFGFQL